MRLWVPSVRRDLGLYLKGLLEDLGYPVTLRSSFPPSARFGKEYKEAKGDPVRRYFIRIEKGAMSKPRGPQIAFGGWRPDYPAASNFIEPLFSCRFKPTNYSRICDPALERKIKRATKLEPDDPQRANRLWAELDHEITDEALMVPLSTSTGPTSSRNASATTSTTRSWEHYSARSRSASWLTGAGRPVPWRGRFATSTPPRQTGRKRRFDAPGSSVSRVAHLLPRRCESA